MEQAQLAVRAAKASGVAASEALANAREQLRLAEGRYAGGLGSVIELGDAQVASTNAAAQAVQARFAWPRRARSCSPPWDNADRSDGDAMTATSSPLPSPLDPSPRRRAGACATARRRGVSPRPSACWSGARAGRGRRQAAGGRSGARPGAGPGAADATARSPWSAAR